MRRFQIAPGVHLSYDAAQKFNRCRISIHFAFPARRETATAHALLPLVMERGYAGCPDMTQMTKKLARLYGADLTVDARPMGCSHNLCVSITGIKDQFALEGEKLTQEYAALALGTAFHPYFVGSTFDPEAVGIEKQMLKKALEDEVNDKRLYCQRQANREFFGDSPAGVRQEGYLEEVDGLTPEALTEAYDEMLRTANIELIVLGCDEASTTAVKDALLTELSAIDRAPLPRAENIAMPRREPVRKVEHFDTTQAKLCMLFTLGRPMQPEQLAAVRLAMALYGGSVTSRLFLNVRERDHLCYYCSSSFQSFTGSMAQRAGGSLRRPYHRRRAGRLPPGPAGRDERPGGYTGRHRDMVLYGSAAGRPGADAGRRPPRPAGGDQGGCAGHSEAVHPVGELSADAGGGE